MNQLKSKTVATAIALTVVVGIGAGYLIFTTPTTIGAPGTETLRFSGILDYDGDSNYHSFRVLENITSMRLILVGPGDFDLYGKMGGQPSRSDYDFNSIAYGNEDFTYEYLEAGIWHVMVYSYEGSGHYDLTVILE